MKPKHCLFVIFISALVVAGTLFSCGPKKSNTGAAVIENLYEDSISTSYTIALADPKGEGMRMTYTFFNMKRADTGNYKMTHVYMRHTGTEDTTIVNGTWKLVRTDSANYILAYSGRSVKRLDYSGDLNLVTLNTDSMIADTGLLQFRQKKDNDMRNSTVHLMGKVVFGADKNAEFIDVNGDSIPILKISAFGQLAELNDSIDLDSPDIRGVEVLGTIQIRMAMDGKSTKRSLIVEEVLGVKR
ncbi:MAG TPA: hypothetical protein VK826_05075 [Bacteroidia bacterium]|nr:hypothetical protein [Bacteroidia bacterium]